jgi:exopolyphosphatase / guanosine-5'-triphosphate,3'-diphosphate pyrophosphatase
MVRAAVKKVPASRRASTAGPVARLNGHRLPHAPPRPMRRATPHGLRVAAIDIGTNSVHMVIVEVTDQLAFRILGSEKDLTNLGSAALVHHKLTRRAMVHTYQILSRYTQIARKLDCDVIRAYATSAVRECANGGDFVQLLKLELGLDIRVISAQEEARLIYLAVRQAVDLGDQPTLIVDIGGGSAEIIVGTAEKPLLLQSRKLGASRLTQQFVLSDPISKRNLKDLEKHIDETLKPLLAQAKSMGIQRVIGTSGTMENVAAMCHAQYGEKDSRHRLLTLMSHEDFAEVYKRLRRLPVEDRRELPGLDPGRADQIVAGATVVNYLFENLGIESVEVCDRAMREGMIIDYMQTHWPKIRLSVQIRDPRRRSIMELGRRCNYNEAHALQVANLSLSLFDQLKSLHRLDAHAREMLEYAAITHDIGWHIGHSSHHKHSYYLVKNGDLDGFSPVEIEIIANVARYHRRSAPKKSHEAYMSLRAEEREIVCKLAALLRIADGLDRGHYGNVRRLKVVRSGGKISIRLLTSADPELELWGARHKTEMFETLFHKQITFAARQAPGE